LHAILSCHYRIFPQDVLVILSWSMSDKTGNSRAAVVIIKKVYVTIRCK
jgi:hypothetical protein